MMKNALYFMLKASFSLKIITFCLFFFGHVGKRLHKEAKFNFKIYGVTDWAAKNYSILQPNISSKDNQAVKFGQLTIYNIT